jgi:hypothetical protein
MQSWFSRHQTSHELITLSPSGYTNEGITMEWLDHFIKHRNCGPGQPWQVLLVNRATCHENARFVLKAIAHNIEIVKFPSHLTHLLQPLDVGCFRAWKHWQQVALMNAIRAFVPEYNVRAFFRDLPFIRQQTFKPSTIKHAFRDAGMWPVDFKAVQRKIIEYRKKQKQKQQQQAQKEWERLECVTRPRNNNNYDLPELLPPQSYAEC